MYSSNVWNTSQQPIYGTNLPCWLVAFPRGKLSLDTNCFIDTIVRKPEIKILDSLKDYVVYISTLSFHIYCYTYKIKMPDKKVLAQRGKFQLTDFSADILDRALNGPTDD